MPDRGPAGRGIEATGEAVRHPVQSRAGPPAGEVDRATVREMRHNVVVYPHVPKFIVCFLDVKSLYMWGIASG